MTRPSTSPTDIRLLLIEADADLARDLLQRLHACGRIEQGLNISVTLLPTLSAASQTLAGTARFDLILADLNLPDADAESIVEPLHQTAPETPIIVLADASNQALALRLIQQGAEDYLLLQPASLDVIGRIILYTLERCRLHCRLRKREAQFHNLIANAPIGMAILDAQGRFTEANPALSLLFGLAPEELLGKSLHDYLHPADIPRALEKMRGLQAEGCIGCSMEARYRCPDGSYGWAILAGSLLQSDAASSSIILQLLDISASQRARDALQVSEQRHRNILDSLSEGVVLHQKAGQVVFCNRATEEILGLSRDELTGLTSLDPRWHAIHPDGSPYPGEEHPAMVTLCTGEEVHDAVMGVSRPDGSYRWISVNAKPLHLAYENGNGEVVVTIEDITERQVQERELSESQSRLNNILANAGVGIAFCDVAGKLTETNAAFDHMLGFAEGELIGHTFGEFSHPDDLARELPVFNALLSGERQSYEMEKRYLTRNGREIWVHLDVSGLRNAADEVENLVGVVSDITTRMQYQNDLAESRAFSESILDSMDVSISVLDPDGTIVAVNEGWRRFASEGQGASDLEVGVGLNYFDVLRCAADVENAALQPLLLGMQSVLAGQRDSFNFEYPCDLPDGRCLWFLLRATPMNSSRGGLVVSHIDMTAQHAAQEETLRLKDDLELRVAQRTASLAAANDSLRTEQRKLNFLKDLAERANLAEGLDAALDYCVQELCKLADWSFGQVLNASPSDGQLVTSGILYNRDPLRYSSCAQMVSEACVVLAETFAGQAWQQHRPVWGRCGGQVARQRCTPCTGAEVTWSLALPVMVDGGVVAVMEFFSEHELNLGDNPEAFIDQLFSLLEVIADRKRMISDLQHAKDFAEKASNTKSSFLANMSHEIRTPMNAISGMAELALGTELSVKQRNYISKIKGASEALLRIINDILDFSKIEAGKLTMERVEFNLEDVFDNLGALLAERAEEKGIELAFDVDPQLDLTLIGDPLRLGQVLINLVGNAIKFSEAGTVVVGVEPEAQTDDSLSLHFSVTDQGIGLTEAQQAQLFTAFNQADSSTTRRFGGTGLGLAISKRLIEMMQGRIWIESEFGHGSTFHFVVRFDLLHAARPGLAALLHDLSPQAGKPVLVIDDNAIARHVVQTQLAQLGLHAELFDSGSAALAALEQRPAHDYLFVLCDWRMPEMDGIETIERLRRHFAGRDSVPPMILMTAYNHAEALQSTTLRLDGFLPKPTSASHIYAEVAPLLGLVAQPNNLVRRAIDASGIAHLRGADVLLVEDVEINQEVMLELLSNAGLSVRVANNGVEALQAVAEHTPDCILMDCQMPVMDGFETSRRLRAQPRLRELPIIALTANAMASDRQRCLDAGMNDHVSKPVNLSELYSALGRWMPPRQTSAIQALQPAQEGAAADQLPALPGIDAVAGLAQVSGKTALYLKVLGKFRDQYVTRFETECAAAMQAENWPVVIRLTHSLKGVARTLGAFELGDLAQQMEHAVREDPTQITSHLPPLLAELSVIATGLVVLDNANPGVNEPASLHRQLDVCANLAHLLEERDTSAADYIDDFMRAMSGAGHQALIDEIRAAVSRYDHAGALQRINKLAGQLSQTS